MTEHRDSRDDQRAVSVTVNYVLGLGIVFVLVTGLFIAGSGFVENQRETSIRTELEVIGEQVASDISMADRLAQTTSGSPRTVEVGRSLPGEVSGTGYSIAVAGGSDPYVVVESNDPEVSVTVQFTNSTDVELDTVAGGAIVVRHTASNTIAVEGA